LYEHGFPHELFATFRREAPVAWHPWRNPTRDDDGFWVLTRHADVQRANRDTEAFSAVEGPSLTAPPEMQGTMLVSMDGPEHVRQRRLISAGFTPRMVGMLEEQCRRWATSIVDRALEHGVCDFVAEVAYRLPMHMIADIVGIPEADRDWLFALTNQFIQGVGGADRTAEDGFGVQLQMFEYAQQLGREKRSNPQDDVWTLLSTMEVETDDGRRTQLTDFELDMFFLLLTLAGSETTRNAIAGGLIELLRHPDQLDRLRREPDAMKPAVDEILRWASPVSYFARRATRDVDFDGVTIEAGERVTLWYPSANRDEDVFADPFTFDIARTPNHHVAFGGGGPHFCLGANLARLEVAILFEELLRRTTTIELAEPPTYTVFGIANPILLAVTELPVRLLA
jgi:cholest-4-en-3-one 26-monooxygenase